MKNVIIVALSFLFFSHNATAKQLQFVTKNASNESQLCMEAATGVLSLEEIAEMSGISQKTLDKQIKCNGQDISKFASKFNDKTVKENAVVTENNFALTSGHANKDAQLCVIAASGDLAKLKRAVRAQGMSVKRFAQYSSCNQQSVNDFVRQYGSEQAASQLQKYI